MHTTQPTLTTTNWRQIRTGWKEWNNHSSVIAISLTYYVRKICLGTHCADLTWNSSTNTLFRWSMWNQQSTMLAYVREHTRCCWLNTVLWVTAIKVEGKHVWQNTLVHLAHMNELGIGLYYQVRFLTENTFVKKNYAKYFLLWEAGKGLGKGQKWLVLMLTARFQDKAAIHLCVVAFVCVCRCVRHRK